MRVIAVGCEYSGVSTLIEELSQWGIARGIDHHLDDHFTIPDAFHLSSEEQQAMLEMLPAIKERFQRFQIVYHIRLLHLFKDILLGGFHIEEKIYGPKYYYPGVDIEVREYETDMPYDTMLVHLHATPEAICARMAEAPHPHQLVPSSDVPEVVERFQQEVRKSWIRRKFSIDTTDLTPARLLDTFLERSIPHLNPGDPATRLLTS